LYHEIRIENKSNLNGLALQQTQRDATRAKCTLQTQHQHSGGSTTPHQIVHWTKRIRPHFLTAQPPHAHKIQSLYFKSNTINHTRLESTLARSHRLDDGGHAAGGVRVAHGRSQLLADMMLATVEVNKTTKYRHTYEWHTCTYTRACTYAFT